MSDAGERIGRFSIGGSLAALGAFMVACVVVLNTMHQNPELPARERWGQMLDRVWASPASVVATLAGLGLALCGGYIMARAVFAPQSSSVPPNEDESRPDSC